jgi:hypothetical protein
MPIVTIRREFELPSFGAGKWSKTDHERPLRIQLSVAKALIFLEEDKYNSSGRNIIVFPQGRIELVYDPAPDSLIKGLKSNGASTMAAAQTIYDAYLEAHGKFVSLLYFPGKLQYVYQSRPASIESFFGNATTISGRAVEWQMDGGSFRKFAPRLPKRRGRNPMFKAAQLVTPSRWQELQKAADEAAYVEGELLELYRIRGKAAWGDLRVATIEASIISESLLRAYGSTILTASGFSNSKMKRLKSEMTFNNLLNLLLPLSLSKAERRSMQASIDSVDLLRGIRNDLVHGNIEEKEVDTRQVERGIDAAIKLVRFLRNRI